MSAVAGISCYFDVNGHKTRGYLSVPAVGYGHGVLVLHAWWGLNSFFEGLCDRLAQEGYAAFAPDMNSGKVASTVDEAKSILEHNDLQAQQDAGMAAIKYLRAHAAVRGDGLASIGFSAGAAWALLFSTLCPQDIRSVITFYGNYVLDFKQSQAAYQGHYAEHDVYEPADVTRAMHEAIMVAGRPVEFYTYPGTTHWFFESDRADAYDASAAHLAWERTLTFLKEQFG
ncbi:MAG: dienelactone hydrolase family protein [Chloroflexi bacterium]|nr:dienelactone hydrolase family protein [Chloroflexota bacterium]MCL5275737.1 dienelactone hydrolase family protein [Chloroflexota bacterium]